MTTKTDNSIPPPDDAIAVTNYYDLGRYLGKFAEGSLDLVLLLGKPGIGKTEAVKQALGIEDRRQNEALYVEGHAQPLACTRDCGATATAPWCLMTSTASTPIPTVFASSSHCATRDE